METGNLSEEKAEAMFREILEDDTHWDLMTDKELERRIKNYEKDKTKENYQRILSCLRNASVFYLTAEKDSNRVLVHKTEEGDYLPIYSSKRKIGKEEKQKYFVNEVLFSDLLKNFMEKLDLIGIVLNNFISMPVDKWKDLMKSYDEMLNHIDSILEIEMEAENLSDIMFERLGGRQISAVLLNGETIEGFVWSTQKKDAEIRLDVTVRDHDISLCRKDIKTIKAFPFENNS